MTTISLSLDQIEQLSREFFLQEGFSKRLADALALRMRLAERDGPASHGLAMLAYYRQVAQSGKLDLMAEPDIQTLRPALMAVDCGDSFAQAGLDAARPGFIEMVRTQGTATLFTRRAHYIAALRHDVLPLAEAGLIAIMVCGSRPWVVPHGGTRAAFGTNPMAFACPCSDRPPVVWDQAVSRKAISDVRLVKEEGEVFDAPAGLDSSGQPTNDPAELIDGQRLFTYGAHKGTAMALMIEVLAAGLSGGRFAAEYDAKDGPTNPSGQTIIAIDPAAADPGFTDHLAVLLDAFNNNGDARIPGDGRFSRAAHAGKQGVDLPGWLVERLTVLGINLP
ncbi:MAG: Ldh family oxidoreductase [Pseudomonadota bacterium]